MATHPRILVWRIPWTEEMSIDIQRVRHDLVTEQQQQKTKEADIDHGNKETNRTFFPFNTMPITGAGEKTEMLFYFRPIRLKTTML